MNSQKNRELYRKASERLKRLGIVDPTNMVAFLQDEIDFYRRKIDSLETNLAKKQGEPSICSCISNDEIIIGPVEFVKHEREEQQKKKVYHGFKIVTTPKGIGLLGIEEENENV